MLIVKLYGRLGNQLFQYAAGRNLSQHYNTKLKIDTSFYLSKLHRFNVSVTLATQSELSLIREQETITSSKIFYFEEPHYHFYSDFLKIKNNTYLEGYWQSEKYFKDIKHIILNEFSLKYPLSPSAQSYADLIQKCNSICVHIRRGDYVNANQDALLLPATLDYYQRAFQALSSIVAVPHLFFFSDDPEWVKENLKLDAPSTLVTGNPDYEDLALMSLCKHFIIANSTFSWWGAWLSQSPNKLVYAPKQWFNNSQNDTSDLIPTAWIRI